MAARRRFSLLRRPSPFFLEQNAHQSPKFHPHVSCDAAGAEGRRAGLRWASARRRPAPGTRPHLRSLGSNRAMVHLLGGSDQQKLEPNSVFIHTKTEEESSPMQERRLPPAAAARQQ